MKKKKLRSGEVHHISLELRTALVKVYKVFELVRFLDAVKFDVSRVSAARVRGGVRFRQGRKRP